MKGRLKVFLVALVSMAMFITPLTAYADTTSTDDANTNKIIAHNETILSTNNFGDYGLKANSGISYSQMQYMINLVNKICSGLNDQYSKAKAIHDWVSKNISYDNNTIQWASNGITYKNDYDYGYDAGPAYNVIMTKKAICEGYAITYEVLCKIAGIKDYVVYGYGDSAIESSNNIDKSSLYDHAWNILDINNKLILVDTTWDSNLGDQSEQYFDPSLKSFSSDHALGDIMYDSSIVPAFDTPTHSKESSDKSITVTVKVAGSIVPQYSMKLYNGNSQTVTAKDAYGRVSKLSVKAVRKGPNVWTVSTTSLGSTDPDKGWTEAYYNDSNDTTTTDSAPVTYGTPVYSTKSYTSQSVSVTIPVSNASVSSVSHTFTKNGSYTFSIKSSAGFTYIKTVTVNNIIKSKPTIDTVIDHAYIPSLSVTIKADNIKSIQAYLNGTAISWSSHISYKDDTEQAADFTGGGTYKFVVVDQLGQSVTKTVTLNAHWG